MNAELKAKWIEALRSGRYEQGRERLRSDDGFCCLGVLCDVYDSSQWVTDPELGGYLYDKAYAFLPTFLPAFAALGPTEATLAGLNDEGKSFVEIADYIEANL